MNAPQLSQSLDQPALDEKVWQAWLEKNRHEERASFEKRLRIMLSISPFLFAALLYWLFKTS